MREDFWHFDPSHVFLMLTNHKPIVNGTDEGIWRRIRLVPWTVVIPTEEQDTELGDALRLEADAVLAWLVDGYCDWRRHGLDDPDAVTEATSAYRADSDALGRFLDEKCMFNPHYTVRSSQLYAAWRQWADREGVAEPKTNKAFSTELENKGYDKKKKKDVGAVWQGIGLATDGDGR